MASRQSKHAHKRQRRSKNNDEINKSRNKMNKMTQMTVEQKERYIVRECRSKHKLNRSSLARSLNEYGRDIKANALFIFELVNDWVNDENSVNNLLLFAERDEKIQSYLFCVLQNISNNLHTFDAKNKNAWALTLIKILNTGLPHLCTQLMYWIVESITKYDPRIANFGMFVPYHPSPPFFCFFCSRIVSK